MRLKTINCKKFHAQNESFLQKRMSYQTIIHYITAIADFNNNT